MVVRKVRLFNFPQLGLCIITKVYWWKSCKIWRCIVYSGLYQYYWYRSQWILPYYTHM